jgi:hypothetical protein
MLIYLGTPMVAAGLWKRKDIDRIEASLYRKVLRRGNMVSNKVILNSMTIIRLAGDVVSYIQRSMGVIQEAKYSNLLLRKEGKRSFSFLKSV